MVFSSLTFLCLFLPLTLSVYYLCPGRWRNVVLLAASLVFYAWGEPRYVLLMILSILVNYGFGLLLGREDRLRRLWLILSVVFNLAMLGLFKYADLLVRTFNALTAGQLPLLGLALPIGISFYTFQAMSYTVDVYRGRTAAQKNPIRFGAYIAMFPQLIAGPIVRYSDVETQLAERQVTSEDFAGGLIRFSVGLAKKVLLANQLGSLWALASAGTPSALLAWLGALGFALQIYFDFSGYSDMAIGLGAMLGFRFPENFNYPYTAGSVTEFWRRWHVSLSTWFREYLYIPLGGNRRGPARQMLNLAVVWTLTGLWHGADWNFMAWGLYYFLLLAAEKLFLLRWMERAPLLGRILTLLAVTFGWVLFACETAALPGYLAALFGKQGFLADGDLYILRKYLLLLLVGALGCTALPHRLFARIRSFWPKAVGSLALLFLSLTFLIADSFNPFLYFRF